MLEGFKIPTKATMAELLGEFGTEYRLPICGVMLDCSRPYEMYTNFKSYCYIAIALTGELLIVRDVMLNSKRRFWKINPEDLTAADAVIKPPFGECDIHLAFPAYGENFDFHIEINPRMTMYSFTEQPENIRGWVEYLRGLRK